MSNMWSWKRNCVEPPQLIFLYSYENSNTTFCFQAETIMIVIKGLSVIKIHWFSLYNLPLFVHVDISLNPSNALHNNKGIMSLCRQTLGKGHPREIAGAFHILCIICNKMRDIRHLHKCQSTTFWSDALVIGNTSLAFQISLSKP